MSTKKMLRVIIVMAALLLLTTIGYLLVDSIKQKEEDAEIAEIASLQLFSFSSDNVGEVSFETNEGHFRTKLISGAWTLTETDYPYDLELNHYYINNVCSYMSHLTALRKFNVEADRLEGYGLTEPTIVTCYEGSTEHTLYIGNPSATEEYFYAMVPGDDTVYSIEFVTGSLLKSGTYYLRSHYIVPFHETEITYFSLVHENNPFLVLEKLNGTWHMSVPLPDANVNSARINSMLTNITRIEVDAFITAEKGVDLSEYGLDKPDSVMTVKADAESCVLKFSRTSDGTIYVLNEGTGIISSISTVGFLKTQPVELVNSALLTINFEDTAKVDAMLDDQTHFTMTMDHENGRYLMDDTDVSELDSSALATFRNLFDTMAKLKFEEMVLDVDIPDEVEPVFRFTFTQTDGLTTELSLIETDEENLYWALIDGQYTGFTVRRRALSGNTGVLEFYERMQDAIAQQ